MFQTLQFLRCSLQKRPELRDDRDAAGDPVVDFSWLAIDVDYNSVAFEERSVVSGLTDIESTAKHEQQVTARKRVVRPTVCIASDHADSKRIAVWHHVYRQQRVDDGKSKPSYQPVERV